MGIGFQSLPDLGVALVATVPVGELERSGRQLGVAERVQGQVLILLRRPVARGYLPAVWPGRHRDLAQDLGTNRIRYRQPRSGRRVDADVVFTRAFAGLADE